MQPSPSFCPKPFATPFLPVVFLTAFLLFYFFAPALFTDNDTPWHLATGSLILETGSVPLQEPWSYTAPGYFWLNYSWGWDVMIASVEEVAGLRGVFIFAALWVAGIITALGYVLMRRGGASQDPIMITLAVVLMVLFYAPGARPQLFSYAAALVGHFMLHQNRTSATPKRILLTYPLLMLVWVNMHSGWPAFRRLVVAGAISLAAIHINPMLPSLGLGFLPAVYASLGGGVTSYISEWHPYRFQTYAGFDVIVLILFLAASFRDAKAPAADRIITAAWFLAALSSIRNFPVLAIVCAPFLALQLEQCLLHKSDSPLFRARRALLAWAGVAASVVLLAIFPLRELATRKDAVIAEERTPVAALEFIRKEYPGLQFFNSWSVGGYIVYYNRDVHKVAMDGRGNTAFPEEVLTAYIGLRDNEPLEPVLKNYPSDGFFLDNMEAKGLVARLKLEPGWKAVYEDKLITVFVSEDKVKPENPPAP
jgi:hypothetical protein